MYVERWCLVAFKELLPGLKSERGEMAFLNQLASSDEAHEGRSGNSNPVSSAPLRGQRMENPIEDAAFSP